MLYEVHDGKVYTASIQYSAALHCNLRCAHCSHLSPYVQPHLPSLDSFAADVRRLAQVLRARTIVLLGGEPLLHPELADMARLARESGIAASVTVTTNGLLLDRMPEDFWRHVDIIRLSLYPSAHPGPAVLATATERARAHAVRLMIDPVNEFRMATVTQPHPMDLWTRIIFATCGVVHRQHCHMFADGWLHKCSLPVNLPDYVQRLGQEGYDPAVDGFYLHGEGDLLAGIKRFLFSSQPLDACRYCLGWLGNRVAQRQLTTAQQADPGLEPITRAQHFNYGRALYGLARCAKWATVDKFITRPAR